MKILNSSDADFTAALDQLLDRDTTALKSIDEQVNNILSDVKARGDQAVIDYTQKFDNVSFEAAEQFEVSEAEVRSALDEIDPTLRCALDYAAKRIRDYHQHQCQQDWNFVDDHGGVLGQRITAIEKVGLYVPGGKAAYPSSVLMSAIPAKVAGVNQLVMTVPTPNNEVNINVLAAAAIAGVDRIFKIGGAQAIAAMAYGTHHVPRVDKIVGPGNAYVAAAKKMVFGEVGIDMIAGPSEVLVVSDASADPDWVAMDLFAQAEHDEMAQSIHITTDPSHHQAVSSALQRLLPQQQRHHIISSALADHGALILADNDQTVIECVNRIAPEHLELIVTDVESYLPGIKHAGAIFIGQYSAEVLGDYCAGPNHVLPTSGTARFSSPLGVYDFQKRSSIIRFTKDSAAQVADYAAILADAEGLSSHSLSAQYRRIN